MNCDKMDCEDESKDANPYTVKAQEPLQQAPEPLRFDGLPRELQSEVLKRTHTHFEVAHHMEVAQHTLGLWPDRVNGWLQKLPYVPVVLRYEFILQRLLADGHRMKARISRSLDPALKQTPLWQTCPAPLQGVIERAAAKVIEIPWFLELQFDDFDASNLVFYFVHAEAPQRVVDKAPRWTMFSRNSEVLDEVRAKMEQLFCLPCRRLKHPN